MSEGKEKEEDIVLENEEKNKQDRIEKVNWPFITQEKKVLGIFKKVETVEKLKEGVLLLIREDGYIDVLQNVKSGTLIIKTQKGEKKKIFLPDGLKRKLRYGGREIANCWVAYENCGIALPEDPIMEAELLEKITSKLAMNFKDANEIKGQEIKKEIIKYVIIGIVIIILIIMSQGIKPGTLSGIINTVTQTNQTIANVTLQ